MMRVSGSCCLQTGKPVVKNIHSKSCKRSMVACWLLASSVEKAVRILCRSVWGHWRGPQWWMSGALQLSTGLLSSLRWQRLLGSSAVQATGNHCHSCHMADPVCPHVHSLFPAVSVFLVFERVGTKADTLCRALKSWENCFLTLLSYSWWGKLSQSWEFCFGDKMALDWGRRWCRQMKLLFLPLWTYSQVFLLYCVVKTF